FVDVIYNGEYEGAYQLCDQVEVNPGRVELTEMAPEDVAGDALTGGYFIEIDAYADQEISWFKSNKGIPVTIKSPDDDEIVAAQSAYIKDYFNKLETALWSSDFTDPDKGYRKYLDLESFIRYFIVCELDGNLDSFWSTYMWKERGEDKFQVGPVWDIDLGFQNYGSPNPVNNMTDFLYTHNDASKANGMKDFVDRIIKQDAGAKKLLSDIWSELRQNGNLNYEFFEERIDEYAKELEESQTLNFERWPILNMSVQKNQKVFGSYEGEVNNIKTFLSARFTKLDNLMDRHTVGIDDIAVDTEASGDVELFNLQGQRVDTETPLPGIYIRRTGSKVEKVVIH
ncbi:MAG: CotH kinase family protein, partial [Muribaculaceae bacterium]|nr:CotH kinase family protein [Muribaculaceae bacterium]